MTLFIYSDESGTFDKRHNSVYTFGGLVLRGTKERDAAARAFLNAERAVRETGHVPGEVKAAKITPQDRARLFESLSPFEKFGVVIEQKQVNDHVYTYKEPRQRYLDWAYKMGVKKKLKTMVRRGAIEAEQTKALHVFADEHTTATNGLFELTEELEKEFRYGTFNWNFTKYFPPLFTNMNSVTLDYCDSEKTVLTRAADIVANTLYHASLDGRLPEDTSGNFTVLHLPSWSLGK